MSVNGILKIQKVYELFLQRKLNMRLLMDYYFVLRKMAGENETFRGGGLLGMIGVRRFAKGVMWLLQETMGLEREQMPWKPLEKEGRFLMAELMQENSRWQHLLHRITYLFFFH